jgi:hypothetical protein
LSISSSDMTKLVIKAFCLVAPLSLMVFCTNWFMDPANIKSDDCYESGIAQIMLSQKNVANLVNFRERILQRKLVAGMSAAPEIAVFGSSRSMAISSDFFKGHKVFNNSVSGASVEDHLAIFDLYRKKNSLPRTVILGLDPWVLNSNNQQKRWEELRDEYFEMKAVICAAGQEAAPRKETGTVRRLLRYREFFSPAYFSESIAILAKSGFSGKQYWATDQNELLEPVKRHDGSLVYGTEFRERTLEAINRDAKGYVKGPIFSLSSFSELAQPGRTLLENFIGYLKANHVHVVLFLPPYHPQVYAEIRKNDAYKMVDESERWYRSLARKYNLEIRGSFDPAPLGLQEFDFYDGMHPKNEAIQKIFTQREKKEEFAVQPHGQQISNSLQ